MNKLSNIPILPLRDIVVFPNMVVPLFVGREASIKALEDKEYAQNIKKFGSSDSGALLGDILGPLLKRKKPKK